MTINIKCPICGLQIPEDDNLFNHLYAHDEADTAGFIVDLVEKGIVKWQGEPESE